MKLAAKLTTICSVLGAVVAFEPKSLSEYIDEIPTCSLSGFAKGMREEGCDTSTIDSTDIGCLCKNAGRIAVVVSREVEAQCALDFGQAVGKACGVWIAWSVSASDLPRATSILGDKLKGKGGTAAKTSDVASSTTGVTGATGQPSPSATGGAGTSGGASSSAASPAATPSSTNLAAIATGSRYLGGVIGAAAVAAAALI